MLVQCMQSVTRLKIEIKSDTFYETKSETFLQEQFVS